MITDTIQLTPAELEMIKLKREKEEIEKREKELKRIADLDNQVIREKASMKRALEKAEKAAAYMKEQFRKLNVAKPGLYIIDTKRHTQTYKVTFYTYNEDRTKYTENIYWKEDLILDIVHIARKDQECDPDPQRDLTRYSNYKYFIYLEDQFHSSSNKMVIAGVYRSRTYTNILTCHTKIQEDIDAKAVKASNKLKREKCKIETKKLLSEKFPDAEIKISEWETSDSKVDGTIAFNNGYSVSFYTYSSEPGKIYYSKTNIDYKKSMMDYIEAISKIK